MGPFALTKSATERVLWPGCYARPRSDLISGALNLDESEPRWDILGRTHQEQGKSMQRAVLRQAITKHQNKLCGGLLLLACLGWADTYLELRRAETSITYVNGWWDASKTALRYVYAHNRDPHSIDTEEARENMLSEVRNNPEVALTFVTAAKKVDDPKLHQQLIKEVANVSTQLRMAIIGSWLLDELDETSSNLKANSEDGFLNQEQRTKLASCYQRAKQVPFTNAELEPQIRLEDNSGPAGCDL